METVGDLRRALRGVPDETPLAISTDKDKPDCGEWELQLDGEFGATICGR